MPLRLSRGASADLDEIYRFGLDRWGEAQAERYAAAFWAAATFVEAHPIAARLRTETSVPVRVHRFQSHLIVYREDADGVLVVRIPHGRSDWIATIE